MGPVTTGVHTRDNSSLTARLETQLLIWIARRLPQAINSDQLSALGLASMAAAGLAFAAFHVTAWAAAGVIVALALNWFGDSLDGTVARVRNQERPRYGFYLDHVIDLAGTTLLVAGMMACSGLMQPLVAGAVLVGYLLVSSESYLATLAVGIFRMSFMGFGPTELRLLLMATMIAVDIAVLHNFAWHERWTVGDRAVAHGGMARRLLRFHLGTGLTSLVGNVIVTAAAIELLHVPTLVANAGAVAATNLANFLVADRWVFSPPATASLIVVVLLLFPSAASAAELRAETIASWNRHVAAVEMTLRDHESDMPVADPEGRAVPVPGGTIHEWRGSVLIPGITVAHLVHALETPGLPPPADDVLDARVMRHDGDALHVYLKLARTAIITVTYDTEHDVRFTRRSAGFVTSRSVSTSIRESSGSDRGFLWRLNSYWRYRQVGDAVLVDVLSLSLSRDVPSLVRPVAGPVIDRIARESMKRTLDAVDRFGRGL